VSTAPDTRPDRDPVEDTHDMDPEHDDPGTGDVVDPATGRPRVLDRKCATCIYRPGNLMHLQPGRREDTENTANERGTWIVCHATLPATGHPHGTQAICRGYWDVHQRNSAGCRLATFFGGPVEVPAPNANPRALLPTISEERL
jgi:hypothetical protein